MNRYFLVLVFGLLFFGFVSGVEETISVIVIENSDYQTKTGRMIIASNENISEEKIGYKYSSVNGFSAEITPEEFKALQIDPSKNVFVDKTYHANLDVSVPYINADDTQKLQSNNLNITGSGQTVCIIDTGVNYSHPAFGGCYGDNDPNSSCKIIGGYDFVNVDSDPMDDAGHGTHVAGIVVSGNDTYGGVSPEVKIISIKALDESGEGNGADIAAGIDWCVNNASKFNISVISMSLGDNSTYNTYCNSNYFANFIDNAVSNNITVIVSAGNCDLPGQSSCTSGVAVPACVESAIIAGAVNDVDTISLMRGALLELMAPGINIMSTLYDGDFGNKGGTSMSAPHIAGTVALMNQYLNLSGQKKTPSEIEIILNDTGVVLDDSAKSGYNFSRIDVYSAILSLDVDVPNVTLVSPVDNHVNSGVNQTFVCNATDWQLANVTFKIWNSSGVLYNYSSRNLTGTSNATSFNLTNMSEDIYKWNCFVTDSLGNVGNTSNYTLTVGGAEVELVSPEDGNYTNVADMNFICNSSSDSNYELSNVTFYLWNSSWVLINTSTRNISGFSNQSVFNYTFSEEGNYSWACLAVNNNSDEGNGVNYSLVYDVSVPVISSVGSSVGSSSATVTWVTNESANSSLYVSGGLWSNSSSYVTNRSIEVSGLSASTVYNYNVTSCDRAGNCNSSAGSFTTDAAASTGSPGGSTTSTSTSSVAVTSVEPVTYDVSVSEVSSGYTKNLKKNEKINFSIFDFEGGRHLLSVDDVGIDYVELTIESDPISLKLGVGQSVKLNLTSAVYYDLFVKLNAVVGDAAELTIQLINEPIEIETIGITGSVVVDEVEDVGDYSFMFAVLVIIFVLVVLVVSRVHRKKLKGSKSRKKDGKKVKT